ncbi:FkbM family methyltransferase [Variovorax sp. Root318D1]|uniref:FkbM family methyltransferase n=1 Tax=Variovorax sp. Root318D1 TaxID=1736513 RepID=UPI00138ECAD6|nr:FkbM family methyltransferase [Variovorax sp. Root318D1]
MITNESHIVSTRYGQMHLLGRDSVVSESLALYGEWAQREIDFLAFFIAPGSTVLDIGAFIGTHTLAFSSLAGGYGTVIAFEPRAEAFELLSRNIRDNHRMNVRLRQEGVADAMSTIELHRLQPGALTNFAGLALEDDGGSGSEYEVPLITVDSLLLPAVDLMKIDVEGMERQVLEGAQKTIASLKPAIFAEANSISAGIKILNWCQSNGYECFGHLTDAFNPDNFNGETRSIFDGGKELNLLLLPAERALPPNLPRVFAIDNADDIAALLLHKPQYPHEVLKFANRQKGPGLLYPSPAAQAATEAQKQLQNEVSDLQSQLQAANASHAATMGAAEEAARANSQSRDRLKGELNALQLRFDAEKNKIDTLLAQLAQESAMKDHIDRQLTQANEHLDALNSENKANLAALALLRGSRSWKFTAPLRYVSHHVRSVLNRFTTR